jgi:hypothetical protein
MVNEFRADAQPMRLKLPQVEAVTTKPNQKTWPRKLAIRAVIASALTASLLTGGVAYLIISLTGSQISEAGATLGQVALSESQLRDQIISKKLTAYWVGPVSNAKYSLIANSNGQVFVRYLLDGKGLEDTNAKYLVVATYPQSDAFSITKAAGNQPNAISFTNVDGAQVFYSKSFASNVYVAYPDVPYTIEIFDPTDGGALSLATTAGVIQKIN